MIWNVEKHLRKSSFVLKFLFPFSGPVKKSFTEVRVASLRASGLLAARRATPMISDIEKNSTACDHRDNPVDYCEVREKKLEIINPS